MGALSIRSIGQRVVLHVHEDDDDANLSGYTTLQMLFTKPDGTQVTKTAQALTPPGTDGRLYYELEEGFLSLGRWTVRGILTVDPTHKYWTQSRSFVPED